MLGVWNSSVPEMLAFSGVVGASSPTSGSGSSSDSSSSESCPSSCHFSRAACDGLTLLSRFGHGVLHFHQVVRSFRVQYAVWVPSDVVLCGASVQESDARSSSSSSSKRALKVPLGVVEADVLSVGWSSSR